MKKLLPIIAAVLVATAACGGEKGEGPATDAEDAAGAVPVENAGSQEAAPSTPSAAATDDTAAVAENPAAATDPPPAATSTAPAAESTGTSDPRP